MMSVEQGLDGMGAARLAGRARVMNSLKARLDALIGFIPPGAPVIYIDVPIHLNVGDLLIFNAVDRLLAHHDRSVTHRFGAKDHPRFLEAVTDRHVLLLHGGGNLGDLWPEHEALRQHVLRRFPRNRIVILPQTAHFDDLARAPAYGKSYREHPECVVFVRDHVSRDLVEGRMGVPCSMMPDPAHFLWQCGPAFPADPAGDGDLVMCRTDKEASPRWAAELGMDWQDILTPRERAIGPAHRYAMRLNPSAAVQRRLMASWCRHRDRVIRRAATHFGAKARIRADRLHGILLGCLLGKDVVMADNNYGKLSAYFDAWMPGLVRRAI